MTDMAVMDEIDAGAHLRLWQTKIVLDPSRAVAQTSNPYNMHLMIRPLFPERHGGRDHKHSKGAVINGREVRDVQWRLETSDDRIELYIRSAHPPDLLRLPPGVAAEAPETRSWEPRILPGTPLVFYIHASPYRERAEAHYSDKKSRRKWRVSCVDESIQMDWLKKRLKPAADVTFINIMGCGPNNAVKYVWREGARIRHEMNDIKVDYGGMLVVRNEQEILRLIANGIGPGKIVGLGMLAVTLPARA